MNIEKCEQDWLKKHFMKKLESGNPGAWASIQQFPRRAGAPVA